MARIDKDAVKQAASGRWKEIAGRLGGLSPEQMEDQHQPCPRCQGRDRYRAFDDFQETGGVVCNQCGKFGDGFATLEWLTGKKFADLLTEVAEIVGVAPMPNGKPPKARKEKADPAKDLEFRDWNQGIALMFCQAKGITEESLIASGARRATYKKIYTVIAWPILSESLNPEEPAGWVLANYNGRELPKWDRDGNQVGETKYKITYGSGFGVVGLHGVERLKTQSLVETVWKVEGISDMLAMWDLIPEQLRDRIVVVTTANGSEETPRWQAGLIGTANCNVIHDADKPGQAGAAKWAKGIALQVVEGKVVRNVQLPYPIEETKGKDLRDWARDGNTYAALEALAQKAPPIAAPRAPSGEVDYSKIDFPVQELIMKLLQSEVLYEEANGYIRVFSSFLRKTSTIRDINKLSAEFLVQVCGPPAMGIVSAEPDGETTFSIKDIRKAFTLYAGLRRGKNDERGVGIWQGLDDFGHETESIVLVNDSEGARWNGDKVLRKVLAPRVDGLVLDYGAGGKDWFDFDLLESNLKLAADPEWCKALIHETYDFFAQWKWQHQHYDPLLVTGIVMASWIETIWSLRPMVSISGESNSGKSYLFEAMGGSEHRLGIFGRLAYYQEKSSEAGIRQLGIGNCAKIVLCDEFEQSKDRQKTMEMFRASSRGGLLTKGTSDQKGREFRIRHIAWVAAIESGLMRSPDQNRFIQLTLLKPDRKDHGKLRLPDGDYLYQLGQRLLAASVRYAIQAKEMAVVLKQTVVEHVDARAVECYAVPAAIIGAASGYDIDETRQVLQDLLKGVDSDEQSQSDQEDLLATILSSQINCGPKDGMLTISQIIEQPLGSRFYENNGRLEGAGITLCKEGMFIDCKQVARCLLRNTQWDGQRIDQILLRLPLAKRDRQRLAGSRPHGIWVPDGMVYTVDIPENQDGGTTGQGGTENGTDFI